MGSFVRVGRRRPSGGPGFAALPVLTVDAVAAVATNPVPVTTTLSPSTSARWEGAQTGLALTGSNFIASSVVYVDGVAMTTTYVSPTVLTYNLPATALYETGSRSVTVVNPTPGGGTSNASTFTVTNPAYLDSWYRSDLGVTVSGTIATLWANQSGIGNATRNLGQNTAARRPVYSTADANYNSKPSLQFDGIQT